MKQTYNRILVECLFPNINGEDLGFGIFYGFFYLQSSFLIKYMSQANNLTIIIYRS